MQKEHYALDNPVWEALQTGNSHLARGTDEVKMYQPGVSPLAGMKEYNVENFDVLHGLAEEGQVVILFSKDHLTIPQGWKMIVCLSGYQMLYNRSGEIEMPGMSIPVAALSGQHVPAMLHLTQLTNPGPFSTRTIEFGHYEGIFENNALVALAGQRLFPQPFAEISAVCTHPDYVGKGYARLLLARQVRRMLAAGNQPFLHVREDNTRAVTLYQQLGFSIRSSVVFYVLQRVSRKS